MVVKSAILPVLRQDIPLGLAPLVSRDAGENNNDRLAALGKHVLEMAVMQGLFSRRPCLTGNEMKRRKTDIVSDSNILKWIQGDDSLNRIVSQHNSTLGNHTANQLEFLFHSFVGALFVQEGIGSIQDWMDNVVETELRQTTSNITPTAPPAYQSQAGPNPEAYAPTTPPRPQNTPSSPDPSIGSSSSFVFVPSTTNGLVHPITVARMHELAVKHFCVLRFESSSTGPCHSPTWTATCLIDDVARGTGSGRTKKIAEQEASRAAHAVMHWELWSVGTV